MSDVATRAPRSAGPATLWGLLDIGLRTGGQRVKDRDAFQVREGVEVNSKKPMTTYLLDPSGVAQSRPSSLPPAFG